MTTAQATATADVSLPRIWLRGRNFDLTFIFGTAGLALLCAVLILFASEKIILIAQLNVLLLATPHFVATYTRLCFDRESVRKYFVLLVPLPILIIAMVTGVAYTSGAWMIASLYLYWQWWHFSRQSFGISRMYLSQTRATYTPHMLYDNIGLYALPLCGILYRSFQQPERYLGMEIKTLPVPIELVWLAGAGAAVVFVLQLIHWARAYRAGKLAAPYLYYVATHYTVFTVSYLLITNLNHGWLVFNVWHNFQYIVFVWMYNNRRWRTGEITHHKVLSDMSRENTVWAYCMVLVIVALALNAMINVSAYHANNLYALLPWALIFSMSITFHHYTVDAVIWKRKRRTLYK